MFHRLCLRAGLPCLSLAFLTSSATGLSIRDDVAQSTYQTLVDASPFSASGQFDTNHSGTLIAPNWVLASAHGGSANTFTTSDGTTANVVERIAFPNAASAPTALDGNDFALLRLATPITSVPTAKLHDPGTTGLSYADLLGQIAGLTAIYGGGGETGTGSTGVAQSVTGTRHVLAGTNMIDTVGAQIGPSGNQVFVSNLVLSDFDENVSNVSNDITAFEVGVVNRDSGGGLWVDLNNGQDYVLIGVHSSATDPDDDDILGEYGHHNISTVLTPQAYNWIVNTVPEPTSLAMLALGSAMMIRRRR